MSDSAKGVWFIFLFLAGLGIASYGLTTVCMNAGESKARNQATEAGAAHWAIDPKTGEKEFVWDGKKIEKEKTK